MAIRIKTQRDYLLTEVSVELPCDLNALDYLMRSSHGTGKIVAVYSDGGLLGVNIEQKTKIRENVSDQVRELIGVETREINGHYR
jgi:hypothetical protein